MRFQFTEEIPHGSTLRVHYYRTFSVGRNMELSLRLLRTDEAGNEVIGGVSHNLHRRADLGYQPAGLQDNHLVGKKQMLRQCRE
jgi:hypothetical protein